MPYTITLLTPADIATLPDRETHPPDYMSESCQKCGKCCEHFECPANDSVTHLCKVYGNRPTVCRQWPLQREHLSLVNCPGYHYNP